MVRRSSCGFTLVEVVVAVLITALVLGGVYGVFGGVTAIRDRLEEEGTGYHQARVFFDRIGSELSSLRFTPVGGSAPLVAGSNEFGFPFVEFNTELSSPLQHRQGGLSRVRYELRQDSGTSGASLYRSDQRLLVDLAASEPLPFITGLSSFAIRYYGNGAWYSDWTSPAPPQLIEITLIINRTEGDPVPFRSSFVVTGGRG